MGNTQSRREEIWVDALNAGSPEAIETYLRKDPQLATARIRKKLTTPLCRIAFKGRVNIAGMLLNYGAVIDEPSSNGNTPIMWAAFVGETKMVKFLFDKGADSSILNNEGFNVLDMAIKKMNYFAALFLHENGLPVKTYEEYFPKLFFEYNLKKFLKYLLQKRKVSSFRIFYKKPIDPNADMVVDPRETWKHFINRVANFEEAPMIEREKLAENIQPHKSLYGKVSNWVNGINPYPPKSGENREAKRPLTPPHAFPRTGTRKVKRQSMDITPSNTPKTEILGRAETVPVGKQRERIEIEEDIEVITVEEKKGSVQYSTHAEYDPNPINMSPEQMRGVDLIVDVKGGSPEQVEELDVGGGFEGGKVGEFEVQEHLVGDLETEGGRGRGSTAGEEDVHVVLSDT